jgi:exopolysaccharide biosynthesis polyprenyl glycosylphosphotransferase
VSSVAVGGVAGKTRRRPSRALGGLLLGGDLLAFAGLAALIGLPSDAMHGFVVVITMVGWAAAGLYRFRCSLSVLDDLPWLARSVLTAIAVSSVLSWLVDRMDAQRGAVTYAVGFGAGASLVRIATYAAVRRLRSRGVLVQRAIVIGADSDRGRLVRDFTEHPACGVRIVGGGDDGRPDERGDVRVPEGVDAVVVVLGTDPGPDMLDLGRTCGRRGLDVYLAPPAGLCATNDRVWRERLVRLRPPGYFRPSWRLKRMLDVLVAGVALVVLAPVMLATALAVRIAVGRPVIFRQERLGRDGRPFMMLKFRSMHPADETESHTRWTIANDARVGRVGRLLRALSLDELPQLVNVMCGDMSIVGPRPERPFFARRFAEEISRYDDRLRVPGGLTGWAAVHGLRGDTSIEDRAAFDNDYIENWSLWMDLKVMARTVPALVRRSEPAQGERVVLQGRPSPR